VRRRRGVPRFGGTEDVAAYRETAGDITRAVAWEFHEAASEAQALLAVRLSGHPLLFGLDVRRRAKKVADRLRRAGEAASGAFVEVEEFYGAYGRLFLDPARRQEVDENQEPRSWTL
jgi:hypothetical protein